MIPKPWSLHPGIGSRLAWRARQRRAVLTERISRYCASDEGRSAEWLIAALMTAGVLFGIVRQLVIWMEGTWQP